MGRMLQQQLIFLSHEWSHSRWKICGGGGIIKLYFRGLRSHVELLVVES